MTIFRDLWRVILTVALATSTRAAAAPAPNVGVRVEDVAREQAADRAGIREGDTLRRWVRGDLDGVIDSPFDIRAIEVEQAPRGSVTLEGFRGEDPRVWVVGPDTWGLKTRPDLPNDQLAGYATAREHAKAGRTSQAARSLLAMANTVDESAPRWLRVWLLVRVAETWAEARQWSEADDAYRDSIQKAAAAAAGISTQLLAAWGETFQQRNDWASAEKYYRQSIAESPKEPADTLMIARSLNAIGYVAWWRGDLAKAEDSYRQSLAIRERLAPESLDVAASCNGLGGVAYRRGDLATAEEYYRRALTLQNALAPDSLGVARSLNNLGLTSWQRGDLSKAEEYHGQALTLHRKLAPDSIGVAASLTNLGIVAWERGNLAQAEQSFQDGMALQGKLAPGSLGVAGSLSNLGTLAWQRGDLTDAERYLHQAMDLQNKLAPGGLGVAAALDGLGLCAHDRGDLATAEKNQREALAIREHVAPDSLGVAESLKNIGDIARERGDLASAEATYRRALGIRNTLAPGGLAVAESLNGLGDLARDRHDLAEAERDYRGALAIRENLAPGSRGHAESLAALAWIRRHEQQLDAAAELYERALAALESETARMGGTEEVRSAFRARHAAYYADYMELLLAQHKPELAFQVLERSRAQTFLEMLSEARLDIRRGAAPDLLERERSLRQSLSAKSDRRLRLLAAPHTDKQMATLKKDIEDLLTEYRRVEGELRTSGPAYAALMQPQTPTSEEVQQQLLDDDTLLLEFALGEGHSYLWLVSTHGLTAHELPGRATIEDAARRVYTHLTARNRSTPGEAALQEEARGEREDSELQKAAAALSQMLLGPIASQLGTKRLLIVSDGALPYVPFEVLPAPAPPNRSGVSSDVPLVDEHEIVYLPSISVLAEIRKATARRTAVPRTVAVLADPIFGSDDSRIARNVAPNAAASPSRDPLTRSGEDLGLTNGQALHLPRLPFSRQEADAILKAAAGDGLEALGFDANRATATNPVLASYRIVHFATHGLLDSKHPQLSGLVLSMVDRKGQPQNGFLDLQDIYNLNLPADLVVLSACETGLGKEISSEGLLGLTRGFMYAGARRVVASLWKVDDVATAELMKRFYKAMLRDGLRPAAALRRAQVELRHETRWRAPYFWAPFVMQGEWAAEKRS
jgi:CHAT domain-containing protein/Tfp pilus assembly protein PilF